MDFIMNISKTSSGYDTIWVIVDRLNKSANFFTIKETDKMESVTMDDNRTISQLLEAPTVGYEDAIVVPEITADNFELKHDSLNSAAGGNFLDKMPCDCLRIIESKSKVCNSRNKPVVAKVSSSSSTPGISHDVAELKDMVKALLLDKKNQTQAPTPVKAVEESCVTCGGAHSYKNCPATDGNVYRDNIQEYDILISVVVQHTFIK
ncbi:hypothetical protein Tco_1367830 [Tanacetum coccineum]